MIHLDRHFQLISDDTSTFFIVLRTRFPDPLEKVQMIIFQQLSIGCFIKSHFPGLFWTACHRRSKVRIVVGAVGMHTTQAPCQLEELESFVCPWETVEQYEHACARLLILGSSPALLEFDQIGWEEKNGNAKRTQMTHHHHTQPNTACFATGGDRQREREKGCSCATEEKRIVHRRKTS